MGDQETERLAEAVLKKIAIRTVKAARLQRGDTLFVNVDCEASADQVLAFKNQLDALLAPLGVQGIVSTGVKFQVVYGGR